MDGGSTARRGGGAWGRFAALVVRRPALIVLGWIAITVSLTQVLPTLEQAQSGSLGDLVPLGADAIDAERRSAELFAFPVSARASVVERDADGLAPARLARALRQAADANRDRLDIRDIAGAYGVTNAVPGLPFARERRTTTVSSLLFPLDVGTGRQTRRAEEYADRLDAPPTSYVGVTGVIPARNEQAATIRDRLPLVELATILIVTLSVGLYLRSVVAPLATLLAVAVAYLVSIRVIAGAGETLGVSVPSEVEPVLVALLFGVVTDYALFFMSRFRALVAEGIDGREAARRTTTELTPIVVTCGMAVAAGAAALGVAELGFLKAFGPGMGLAVLVGMVVVVTLLPALLALLGGRLFWPSTPRRPPTRIGGASRTERLLQIAVRRPKTTLALALVVVGAMGSGTFWLELGNPLIRGLPAESEPHVAYTEASKGFAPGVIAPITLVVEGEGITERRSELASLQGVLGDQPGVAGVIGPGGQPTERPFGITLARSGDAARFILISSDDPLGAAAIRRLENLDARIGDLLSAVGLTEATGAFAGDTALVAETMAAAEDDFVVVLPAVLLAVALVLAVFLRALVAPLYLVVLAALAPLAALGVAVAFFQGILGHPELTYFVPVVATVLLVSLGSDYNVFIAGSIWAEARHRPLREAIVRGGSGAAHAIAAAGVVLAASFGALALVPVQAFQELAFVLAAGLLIDAFLIRLVIAPAVIVLFEGRRARRQAAA